MMQVKKCSKRLECKQVITTGFANVALINVWMWQFSCRASEPDEVEPKLLCGARAVMNPFDSALQFSQSKK